MDVDADILVLVRTAHLCVRTLILRSVTVTKTGQALAEGHVERMKLLRQDTASYGLSNDLRVAQWNKKRVSHLHY